MDLKQFFGDERAVSPVIGVILMVAITVILAAVIGTFVLGLGDQVQQTTPRASFGFSQSVETVTNGTDSSDITKVTITHESGDAIDETSLAVTVNGNSAYDLDETDTNNEATIANPWDDSGEQVSAGSSFDVWLYETGSEFSTGDTVLVSADNDTYYTASATELAEGDTVRIVYNSPDSDNSATLAKYEVQ